MEGKAALSSGKMIQELQLYLTVEGLDYSLTLKGPLLDMNSVKFPPISLEGDSKHDMKANILLRMSQYDDLHYYMSLLYQHFSELRLSDEWLALLKKQKKPFMNNGTNWYTEYLYRVDYIPNTNHSELLNPSSKNRLTCLSPLSVLRFLML